MDKQETWVLTKGQSRVVLALAQQRQEVTARANAELAEIEATLQETLEMVATVKGIDAKELEFADGETPGEVVMRKRDVAASTPG